MTTPSVLAEIEARFSGFTKTQKLIANYICEHYTQLPSMSTQELAAALQVSDASIIRFSQALGFKGYLELRNELKKDMANYHATDSRFLRASIPPDAKMIGNMNISDLVAYKDFVCLKDFYENFDRTQVQDIVDIINKCSKLYIVGFGTDSIPAMLLNWYISIMGYNTACYTNGGFMDVQRITSIEDQDAMIIFGSPRLIKTEIGAVEVANKKKACTIFIGPESSIELSSMCEMSINVSDKSTEFINSYVTFISLCNMIVLALYESRKEENSKHLHEVEDLLPLFDIL